jgi:MFS family permease
MDSATAHIAHRHGNTVILFTMCLGVFIAQLDSQVVNLALTQIGSDLKAGISQLQWVMDSYNLFYATLLLTGGTLGDLYGRVRIFAAGIGLIVLGSIVCAVAPNGAVLIAGRALTGIGAALEVPTSLAILNLRRCEGARRRHRRLGGLQRACARGRPDDRRPARRWRRLAQHLCPGRSGQRAGDAPRHQERA